jgi:SAM-dependent methyltransferase
MLRLSPASGHAATTRTVVDYPPAIPSLPAPEHVAHLHLLAVINTEAARLPPDHTVRILDAGCGGGRLLAYLARALPIVQPRLRYEIHGFDVYDRPGDDFGDAVRELSACAPGTPWEQRIVRIPADADWPYDEGSFDIILSNQVGEHLRDHGRFFGEIARCLTPQGFSVNLFPLKHVIMEWHIGVPYAHRIRSYDLLRSYILGCNRVGLGSARDKAKARGVALAEFCARQAEYVVKYTGYIGQRDLLSVTKRHGLLTSMRYTGDFYLQKIRQLFAWPPVHRYTDRRSAFGAWLGVLLLRYVANVTVLVEKRDPRYADWPGR